MTMDTMHVGKLIEEAKTTITPELRDHIAEMASKLRCHPSELYRDALYLVFTGATYACHVAKDRRSALHLEGRDAAPASAESALVTK